MCMLLCCAAAAVLLLLLLRRKEARSEICWLVGKLRRLGDQNREVRVLRAC